MTFKKLDNLLKSSENSGLERLIQRAQSMDSLTSGLCANIAPDLAENLIAANLREDGELVLVCSSAAWASRIRFESDRILDIARDNGVIANSCSVRVCR